MKQVKSQRVKIKIKDTQKKITIDKKVIARLAKQILKIKGINEAELSILLVDKRSMCTLNKKFRRIDKPTDVLAFSMREGKDAHLHPEILGDVVICPEIAQNFARIYKTSKLEEICLYLIHGVLHLLGYDDTSTINRSLMEKEQARILTSLRAKRSNPLKQSAFGSSQ